jgi:hypothetical protein
MTYKIGTTVFILDPENVEMIVLKKEVNNFSEDFYLYYWLVDSASRHEVFLGHSNENATRIFETIVEDVFGEVKELG